MSSEFQSQPSVEGGRRRPSITGKVPITEHDAFSEMSQKVLSSGTISRGPSWHAV